MEQIFPFGRNFGFSSLKIIPIEELNQEQSILLQS